MSGIGQTQALPEATLHQIILAKTKTEERARMKTEGACSAHTQLGKPKPARLLWHHANWQPLGGWICSSCTAGSKKGVKGSAVPKHR